jgi:hypothetical protein
LTVLAQRGRDPSNPRLFSRHANLATVTLYDDARHDHAGAVAQVLDGLME